MRMLSVARILRDHHQRQVAFLLSGPVVRAVPVVVTTLQAAGFAWHMSERQTQEGIVEDGVNALAPGLVIIDKKYDFGPPWVQRLRKRCQVMIVDHLCPGAFEADVAVFPGAHLPDAFFNDPRWITAHASLLAGPEYVMISDAVLGLPEGPPIRFEENTRVPKVVLTTGGTDPKGITQTLLPWLTRMPLAMEVTVLIGQAFHHSDRLAYLLSKLPASFNATPFETRYLAMADLAICAFGVTTYELLYLGVPTITVAHTEENAHAAQTLAQRHACIRNLGLIKEIHSEDIRFAVETLLSSSEARVSLVQSGKSVIDGRGALRVAQEAATRTL
jgi:UDP-2,4-diacetamido-2,4,6-trideoxy-beta-L-altropyranose hydrolase